MDHSAFDAYAFLIEGDGKRILYSGDFRGHGRKTDAYKWFLHHAPKNVDYLLLEGTMVGRASGREESEDDLQVRFTDLFKENKLNLVSVSAQNIDRLVTIYKACNAAGKTLVIDPYIAGILKEVSRFARIHYPSDSFKNIRVLFPRFLTTRMINAQHQEMIYPLRKFKITKPEIDKDPGQYVMCIRPSMKYELAHMASIDGGNHIYSLWDGYLQKPYTKRFLDYLDSRGFSLQKIHSSGHADVPTLQEFVGAVQPEHIIPIHTFEGGQYKQIFKEDIVALKDGETLDIR